MKEVLKGSIESSKFNFIESKRVESKIFKKIKKKLKKSKN